MEIADFRHLCMGCMNEKGLSETCSSCGFIEGTLPDSPHCLPPGTILNGQYLLGKVLGCGGFGITYIAWDMNLDMKVAIKEYMPEGLVTRVPGNSQISIYSGDRKKSFDYGVEKFMEEARALAKFKDNTNIISIYNFFMENGTAYFVMEYIEGMSLKQKLEKRGGKIPFEEAVSIILPVISALRDVHAKAMLHRDISPDNIFITNSGMVKLLDFGAARYAAGEHSKSLSIILKPGFAPEEQYRSKGKQGPWTDVYALGATFYKMVTGIIPTDAMDRVHEDDLKKPSELGIFIPALAEKVLLKSLAVSAKDRYQSVDEFEADLKIESNIPTDASMTIKQHNEEIIFDKEDNRIKVENNTLQGIKVPSKFRISRVLLGAGVVAVGVSAVELISLLGEGNSQAKDTANNITSPITTAQVSTTEHPDASTQERKTLANPRVEQATASTEQTASAAVQDRETSTGNTEQFKVNELLENKLNELDMSKTPDQTVKEMRNQLLALNAVNDTKVNSNQSVPKYNPTASNLTLIGAKIGELKKSKTRLGTTNASISAYVTKNIQPKINNADSLLPYMGEKRKFTEDNVEGGTLDIKTEYLTNLKEKLTSLNKEASSMIEINEKTIKVLDNQIKILQEEYDSIKKVIDKNIEMSFKYFA